MIFKRSLVSELANVAGGAFTVIFTIVLAVGMVRILGLAAGGRIDNATIIQLTLYNVLTNLAPLLTVSLFIAVLITLMRWWQDNEMVVWFSSGARSLFSWVRPVLRFTLPMVLFIAVLATVVAPWAHSQSQQARDSFEKRDEVSLITPGRFIELNRGKRVFFVENVDKDRNVQGVFVADLSPEGSAVVTARSGGLEINKEGDRYIVLHDGRRYDTTDKSAATRLIEFKDYGVRLDLKLDSAFNSTRLNALPTSTLIADYSHRSQSQLFWRLSWPVASLLLALLAIPLSCAQPRSGRSLGLIAAGLVFILYLNMITMMETWIHTGVQTLLSGMLIIHGSVALLTALLFIRWVYFLRWCPRKMTFWYWRHQLSSKES